MDREKVIKDNAIRGLQSAIEISGALVHLRKEHAKAILELLKEQQDEIYALQVEFASENELAEGYAELLKEQGAKTGHWIQSNPKFVSAKATGGSRMSTCSNCGKWGRKSFLFCPHCGTKMEGR